MFTAASVDSVAKPPRAFLQLALFLSFLVCLRAFADAADPSTADKPTVIVMAGAPGEEEYGSQFAQWVALWEKASQRAGARLIIIGVKTNETVSDRERLQQVLTQEPKDGTSELWLVLLGHGTFDGKEAKFNLHGPDLTASELANWLQPVHRPLAIIDASSCSSPFLGKLSGTNRVVVTATRSGNEVNFVRFGQYISEAIADPAADLDKDGQTSLLEAFLMGSRRVMEFYQSEGRLATEHALLDDNGDGLGTPPDWFRGVRAVKTSRDGAALDGLRAHQFHLIRSDAERQFPPSVRARRDEIELAIAQLRHSKSQMAEDDYYKKLEDLLLEMARLYHRVEQLEK